MVAKNEPDTWRGNWGSIKVGKFPFPGPMPILLFFTLKGRFNTPCEESDAPDILTIEGALLACTVTIFPWVSSMVTTLGESSIAKISLTIKLLSTLIRLIVMG